MRLVIARRAVVSGRVQGVWYRDSTRQEADRLGVTGWVRNLPDGRVELHAEGPVDAVEALLIWCEQGPPLAQVVTVDADDAAPEGAMSFEIR